MQLVGKGWLIGSGGEPTASRRTALRSAALRRSRPWGKGLQAQRNVAATSGMTGAVALDYAAQKTGETDSA